jgi:hypothetical protein
LPMPPSSSKRAVRGSSGSSAGTPSQCGSPNPGWHCHSALSLAAIGCHPLVIHTVIWLSLLSLSAKVTVSLVARLAGLVRLADVIRADEIAAFFGAVVQPRARLRIYCGR